MKRLLSRAPEPLVTMASNSGWLLTQNAIRMVVGLVTAVWLTRYLGPADFGVYSYVVAFVLIFAGVSSVGMNSLVTRELVEQPDKRNQILGSALTIRITGSLIATVLLLVLAFVLHPELDHRMGLIVFGAVLLVQPLEVVSTFYEAQTQSRYVVWVQLGAAAAYLITVATMITMQLSVVWFLGARLAEVVIVQLGVLTVFALQGHRPTHWRPDAGQVRGFLTEAWPLVVSAFGATLYLRIDQVMLGQMTTATDVGTYAAAARLSEIWYFIPGLIVASAFPYLLRLRSSRPEWYPRRLQQLYDVLMWMGVLIATIVALAAPWLVALLYGDEFAPSSAILRIHVWAGVFIFMRAAFSKWLIAERLLMFSLTTQGAGAIANIALNLVFIPRWAGIGAAWATVISYAVASYLALLMFPATRPAAAMMTRSVGAPVRYLRELSGASSNG